MTISLINIVAEEKKTTDISIFKLELLIHIYAHMQKIQLTFIFQSKCNSRLYRKDNLLSPK